MKIVIDNSGQTCNKFWSYLAPIKYSIDSGEKLFILFPDSDLSDYPNLLFNRNLKILCLRSISNVISFRAQEKIIRKLVKNRIYNLIPLLRKYFKNDVWESWNDRNIKLSTFEKKEILKILSPSSSIINDVEKVFKSIRLSNNTIIIGVHIRRGDYKYWLGGKFYYTLQQYKNACLKVKKEFQSKDIKFLISTNEALNADIFPSCDFFKIPNSSSSKDLYALSLCDYIIGPPSSFSRWAAFTGNRPIRFILPDNKLTKSFRRLISLEQYDNGETVSYKINGELYLE